MKGVRINKRMSESFVYVDEGSPSSFMYCVCSPHCPLRKRTHSNFLVHSRRSPRPIEEKEKLKTFSGAAIKQRKDINEQHKNKK